MPSLFARQNPFEEAKHTLSSWDNCMAKAYCKWPVIVGIIVGALILISVITCIARCICCGAECVCCCFRCCSCCCGSSGGRSGHKRMKSDHTQPAYPIPYGAPAANPYAQAHAAAPPAPPIDSRPVNQQYRSNPMPTFNSASAPERPAFATFDSTRAVVNDDALPPMPTWKDGRDVHIEEEVIPEKRGDMEMDRLDHKGSMTNASLGGTTVVAAPRRSPGSGRSLVSPMGDSYGFPPGHQNDSFAAVPPHRNSPGPHGRPYAQQDDYRRGSPAQNISPVYGAGAGYGRNQQYGRQSPAHAQPYDSYDQPNLTNQPNPYNQQGQYDQQRDYYGEPDRGYNSPSPVGANPYHYDTNTAPYDNFAAAPAPQRSHTPGNAAPYDNFAPVPQRSHTPGYTAPHDNFAPPAPRSLTPGYTPSESTTFEPSTTSATSAYPGQQTYKTESTYLGQQQPYQAFQPSR